MSYMHQRAQVFGHGQQSRYTHGLHDRRAGFHMGLKIGAALSSQSSNVRLQHGVTLAVHHQPPSGLLDQRQGLVQLIVLGQTDADELIFATQRGTVHKDLEGNCTLGDHTQDVIAVKRARRPIKGHIYDRLLFDEPPTVAEGFPSGATRLGNGHLKDSGHATRRSGACL